MEGEAMLNVIVDPDQAKQQAQYLNMRGAQMSQENQGQQTRLGGQSKAKGSKKQLVGTVVGIAAVIAALLVLKAFHMI